MRRKRRAEAEDAPTLGQAEKQRAAVLRLRGQSARLPALGPLVAAARRGGVPRLLEQADLAGSVSVEDIARMKLLLMALFGLLGVFVGYFLGNLVVLAAITAGAVAVGYAGPEQTLRSAAELRQAAISRGLPLAMEVIGLAVEKTSIDAGIGYYCEYFAAETLAGEMTAALGRVHSLNVPLDTAMAEMLRKNFNDDLCFLVAAVGQATQLGGRDLRQMLEVQAQELRVKRDQEVKGRSLRAPVLMTFPTILNVISLLVILGGLAFLQFTQG